MILEICLLAGLLAVASNPSPYFAALGMVGGAGVGCLMLLKGGVGFLSLVLFLVYLGGMLVVFAYCAALVAEPYPEAWGSYEVVIYLVIYGGPLMGLMVYKGASKVPWNSIGLECVSREWWGVSGLLGNGGNMLFFGGWALLLTLFVALEVVRGYNSGALRAV